MPNTKIHVTLIPSLDIDIDIDIGVDVDVGGFFVQDVSAWVLSEGVLQISCTGLTSKGAVWRRKQCFPVAQIRSFEVMVDET